MRDGLIPGLQPDQDLREIESYRQLQSFVPLDDLQRQLKIIACLLKESESRVRLATQEPRVAKQGGRET